MVKAINFKNWCSENITPQAWPRVVLRAVPELRELGVDTKGLQNPEDDMMIDEDAVAILNKWLDELYQTKAQAASLA
ncbi:MAG: hypothetical protein AAGA85_02750 [Bacteroidota bacterium]